MPTVPFSVAVVIPARNESDRIQATVAGAGGLPGVDLVVVVDDGSTDDTAARLYARLGWQAAGTVDLCGGIRPCQATVYTKDFPAGRVDLHSASDDGSGVTD